MLPGQQKGLMFHRAMLVKRLMSRNISCSSNMESCEKKTTKQIRLRNKGVGVYSPDQERSDTGGRMPHLKKVIILNAEIPLNRRVFKY